MRIVLTICTLLYLAYIMHNSKQSKKYRIAGIVATIYAFICCYISIMNNKMSMHTLMIVWLLMVAAYEDAKCREISSVYMISIVIIAIVHMIRYGTNKSNIICGIIVAVMILGNVMLELGVADTMAAIAIISIDKIEMQEFIMIIWFATVGLILHIRYNKQKDREASAPYIPYMIGATLFVIGTAV